MASACRSCNAPIIWARTRADRRIPVDPDRRTDGNLKVFGVGGEMRVEYVDPGEGTHVSHFATCKQADNWRKQ